jgi:hypothetical protein
MLRLGLDLGLPISRQTSNDTANRPRRTTGDAGAEIVQLSFSFLFLAGGILLLALTLEILCGTLVSPKVKNMYRTT